NNDRAIHIRPMRRWSDVINQPARPGGSEGTTSAYASAGAGGAGLVSVMAMGERETSGRPSGSRGGLYTDALAPDETGLRRAAAAPVCPSHSPLRRSWSAAMAPNKSVM